MKWKLTGGYILSIVLVVILVVFINVFIIFGLLIAQSAFQIPIFQGNDTTPEEFAREFENKINLDNNHVTITEEGKKSAERK